MGFVGSAGRGSVRVELSGACPTVGVQLLPGWRAGVADRLGPVVLQAFAAALSARRPDLADPSELVPKGWDALVATVEAFVAAGTSKFVVLPVIEPASTTAWTDHLAEAAEVLLPLQT